jgi:predicted nucleic acid-binding protein
MQNLFNSGKEVFCLDANVFIEAWNHYYSPDRTLNYWELLDEFAQESIVFAPLEVKKEIERKDDMLKKWLVGKDYFFREPDENVTLKWSEIAAQFPELVDNIKGRSLADPWVIAHAEVVKATVVTKEGQGSTKRIRIPDVCAARHIRCVDDFCLIDTLGIQFMASKKPLTIQILRKASRASLFSGTELCTVFLVHSFGEWLP